MAADNCWRENKNKYLFSFLACLVDLKVFEEITVDYLIVGHTGNEVDQLFSILANELKGEILTIEDLQQRIVESPIVPKPVCNNLMFIYDWKSFIEEKFSTPQLQNTSKYNSFKFSFEGNDVKFRGKRLPQDNDDALTPRGGIRIVRKNIVYEAVAAANFRVENINFDEIWKGLRLALVQMNLVEQRRVRLSWDNLRNSLESLPRKKNSLSKMKIFELPKQTKQIAPEIPNHLRQPDFVSELSGDRYPEDIEEGEFNEDITNDIDVVVYTDERVGRPWVGRIIEILDNKKFLLQWYTRKTCRSRVFHALIEGNGQPSTSVQENDSVMFWCMSEKRTDTSFELSAFWMEAIQREYSKLDQNAN